MFCRLTILQFKDTSESSREALLGLPATIESVQTAAVSAVQAISAESIKQNKTAMTVTAAALREELGKAIDGIVGKLTDDLDLLQMLNS
jgi:hypothetical protein